MLKSFLKLLPIVTVAVVFISVLSIPAGALSLRGTYIKNNSDSWVWVTFYNSQDNISRPAFCVAPGQERHGEWSRGGYGTYSERLRFEMTTTNCAHPRYADLWQNFSGIVRFDITGSHKTGFLGATNDLAFR